MSNPSEDWYTAIKSQIETYPCPTRPTNPTKQENVGNVGCVGRVEPEKQPCEKLFFDDKPEPVFKQTVLMTRHNGKAQSCIHCGYWEAQKDRPWWTGACAITGKGKTNKSHCDVPSYEEVLQ